MGEHDQAVVYSILNKKPKPLPELRAEIPVSIGQVVDKALEKNPEKRYQQIDELLDDLKSISAGIVPEEIKARLRKAKLRRRKRTILYASVAVLVIAMVAVALSLFMGRRVDTIESIAVLPLENLTGDTEKGFFVDVATEELISKLGQISGFRRVISRTSIMRYKETDKTLSEIARELNVDAVVEGSVQQAGDRVRIQVRLIDALPEEQNLWGQTYERAISDVLVMYGEMARAIAENIQVKLTTEETTRLADVRQVNPKAYEAFIEGRTHMYALTPQEVETALDYFEEALKIDPNYALAHAGVALIWVIRYQMRIAPRNQAVPLAIAEAKKAIKLDNTLEEAYYALACIKTWSEWDWEGAEIAFQRAIELNPNFPDVRAYYSQFLSHMGRTDEALPHIELAVELDPFNALFHGFYANVLLYQRRYDDAIAAARTGLALQPGNTVARSALQDGFIAKGMYDEQLAIQRARIALDPERLSAFEQGLEEGGYKGAQRGIADVLAARYGKLGKGVYRGMGIARRYLDAGEYNRAIDWLEKAYEEHDPSLPYIGLPFYDPLRSYPRFQDLLCKMNLPMDEKE
jgi:TolB-like protein/Tfp pilus assembly protein PilF